MKDAARRRRAPLFAAAAAIIAIIAVALVMHSRSGESGSDRDGEPQAAFVRVMTVAADATVRESITQNMSIEAVDRVRMTPRVTGRLEKLHVEPGDRVHVGQLIATLDHVQQDALIGSTKAALASARADTQRARAELANAKRDLERYERLVKEGFSTQQQYDSVRTAYASSLAGYDAAAARERQAEAELARVGSAKDDYIMVSPLEGTVLTDYSLTAGEMISPSSPIVDIADLRKMKATLRVPELKIFAVSPGMEVILRFDALPDEEFHGAVSRIDSYVDPSTRTSAVEIELDNEAVGGRLRPGMFGTASLVEREHRDAIVVPDGAVMQRADERYVFVDAGGTASMRPVSTGTSRGGMTHIISGLASGDVVVVFGGMNLNDGDRITASE